MKGTGAQASVATKMGVVLARILAHIARFTVVGATLPPGARSISAEPGSGTPHLLQCGG